MLVPSRKIPNSCNQAWKKTTACHNYMKSKSSNNKIQFTTFCNFIFLTELKKEKIHGNDSFYNLIFYVRRFLIWLIWLILWIFRKSKLCKRIQKKKEGGLFFHNFICKRTLRFAFHFPLFVLCKISLEFLPKISSLQYS